MIGLGTIINVAGIIAGGFIGLASGKLINDKIRDALIRTIGVAVLFVGISGTLEKMLFVTESGLSVNGTLMMVVSLALGTLIGVLLKIDDGITAFGEWLKKKTGSSSDNSFVDGFVTASVTVSVGAMAVIGSIKDALYGDYSILIAKTLIDFIFIIMLTSSMGKGCIFSALSVALVQGIFTAAAKLIEPVLITTATDYLSIVGSVLIFCIGVNMVWEKKFKVADMLPSIVIAVAWAYIFG